MRYLVFGSGTYARLLSRALTNGIVTNFDGFWVQPHFREIESLAGYPVYSSPDDLASATVFIGVSLQKRKGPDVWRRAADLIIEAGGSVGGFCAVSADTQKISKTACIFRSATIEMDAVIGDLSHVRPNVFIGHDVEIGECCYVAPCASLGSFSRVAGDAFIGFGAVVLPGVNIGKNVVVGGGAIVTNDVPSNSVVLRDGSIVEKKNPFIFI